MKKYYIDGPEDDDCGIEIPKTIQLEIVRDYLQKTYYWSLTIFAFLVGFLSGILIK